MKKKYKHSILAGSIVLLLILVFGTLYNFGMFDEFSLIHSETDIDLHTGKMRGRLYLCKIKMVEKVSETKFSKLVAEYVPQKKPPLWKLETVSSDFPLKYSKGGNLLSLCEGFVRVMELGEWSGRLDKEQKLKYLHQFLKHLEKADVQKIEDFYEEIASIVMKDTPVENGEVEDPK